jgi:hypothetical protein
MSYRKVGGLNTMPKDPNQEYAVILPRMDWYEIQDALVYWREACEGHHNTESATIAAMIYNDISDVLKN